MSLTLKNDGRLAFVFNYPYVRIYNDTYGWMIENITKTDVDGNVITIESIINTLLPNKIFSLVCAGPSAIFSFKVELTLAEHDTLTDIVNDYQIPVIPTKG